MQQSQSQYLTYKLGSVCPHGTSKTSTNYVDVACSKGLDTYHRISQATKICNKCATLIMKAINSVDYCPCCLGNLQELIATLWICSHPNRILDQITIKCQNDEKEIHEVPFQQKVCKNCYEKIRASFMFANECVVCSGKENQLFDNIEKTMTKSSFYFFQHVIKQMKDKKFPEAEAKSELEHYCLADPQVDYNSKFANEAKQFGQNQARNHQSKRYELFPKCSKHRFNPISLCNSCLVSILNVNSCPYGCPYQKKQAKLNKNDIPITNETGFLCMYPKQNKDYQYLEYFCVRLEESNRMDKWQGALKKIKYSGNGKIVDKFTLYGATVQVAQLSFMFSGGVVGKKVSEMKSTGACFLVNITDKNKKFSIEDLPAMSQPRSSHGSVYYGDYVYIIGGFEKQSTKCLSLCQKLNLKSKKWQKMAPLKIQRSKPNVFHHNGKIYAMGGVSSNEQVWNCQCEVYNIEKDSWQGVEYKGYDTPFLTGSTALNTCWGWEKADNIITVGGSDYSTSSYFLQEMVLGQNNFKIKADTEQKLVFNRCSASLSLMKTQTIDQKIVLIFGGVLEHETLLSFDAIRLKKSTNSTIIPAFVYDNVQVGSYRLLLRENALQAYSYMLDKMTEQGLISSDKIQGKTKEEILRSDEILHKIEKMWYGVGKCMIGFNTL